MEEAPLSVVVEEEAADVELDLSALLVRVACVGGDMKR